MVSQVILLGLPGAGKGTLAGELTKNHGFIHLSTGNLFRHEVKAHTPLGRKVATVVRSGGYVPDEITNAIVRKALENPRLKNRSFLLDGYPRTTAQAQFLDTITTVTKAVLLEVNEATVIKRLQARYTCANGEHVYNLLFRKPKVKGVCDVDHSPLVLRDDDKLPSIRKRLQNFYTQTQPVVDYYRKKNLLVKIDASGRDTAQLVYNFRRKVVVGG